MRKIYTLIVLAMLPMLAFALPAQGDGNNEENKFGIHNVSMSGCKDEMAAPTRGYADEEQCLEYSVEKKDDGFYLHLKHTNKRLACDVNSVDCQAKLADGVITLTEKPVGGGFADCLCPYDVTCDIGPLEAGIYTLEVLYYSYRIAKLQIEIGDEAPEGCFSVDNYLAGLEATCKLPAAPGKGIYDLMGRRYEAFPFPGVFIKDGKKVVWTGE